MAALNEDGAYQVRILSSKDSTKSTTLTIKTNLDSLESLKEGLQGVDAVVITLASGIDLLTATRNICQAALNEGVKRIILCEFSGNLDAPNVKELQAWNSKVEAREYARSLVAANNDNLTSWSSVVCGSFFEWALDRGFTGFDFEKKTVDLLDGGKQYFTTSSVKTIAKAVLASFKNEELTRNRAVFVQDVYINQLELKDAAEKAFGETFTVKHLATGPRLSLGISELKRGDMTGYGKVIPSVVMGDHPRYGDLGGFNAKARADMNALGLIPDPNIVQRVLASKAKLA